MKKINIIQQKNDFINFVEENISDSIIQRVIIDIFVDSFDRDIVVNKHGKDRAVLLIGWYMLAYQLILKKIQEFNWELLCELYNTNYFSLLCKCKGIFDFYNDNNLIVTMKYIKVQIEERKFISGYYSYKSYVIKFYLSIFQRKDLLLYNNISEINKYKKFLVNDYYIKFDEVDENFNFNNLHRSVMNNIPVNSNYNFLIQKKYILKSSKKQNIVNFNCRTCNNFIKKILTNFINAIYELDKAPHNRILRVFIYYFTESINDKELRNYNDFNFKLLKVQYLFYTKINTKYDIREKDLDQQSFSLLIIQFYRWLLSNNENQSFSALEKSVLKLKLIHRLLSENYKPLLLNSNEKIPVENKFCIIQSEYTMRNAAQKSENYFVNLSDLDSFIQNDIKEFLWHSNISISHRFSSVNILLNFFYFKEQYYKFYYKKDFDHIKFRYFINEDMLYMFVNRIYEEYDNNQTIKSIITKLKTYLKFYQSKYNFNNNLKELLSCRGLYEFDGGNPISEQDLKIIYNAIKKLEKKDSTLRIYTIVFEISLLSNLRLGEILSLQRNCIINKNTIRLIKKTSEKNYRDQVVSDDIISLISEALVLTEKYIDDSCISKWIFIEENRTNFSCNIKKLEFYSYFRKILTYVNDKLENKNYKPYNLRHTFIDNVYKQGVKNDLTLLEMASITGNSFVTAKKYYRKYDDCEMYVETLAKVRLTDTSIVGKVVSNEPKVKRPVRDNLGSCNNNTCTFNLAECLMCKHFITFTNRIDVFESRINKINSILEKSEDKLEKDNLICEKKILSKYLLEMLILKEGDVSDNKN